jgi:hypothetical protein
MNEWEQRELCSDGACVGVLDDHGVCKVCGTKAPDWQARAGAAEAREESAAGDPADDAADAPPPAVSAPPRFEIEGDVEDRKLCPDGACVGLIGDEGTCKVCGAEAA